MADRNRRHWTSPEDLAASREHYDEFPAGAAEAPDELSRRSMLGLMGASAALAGLAGCRRPVETIVPFVRAPEDRIPGVPQHYATTMPFGSGAYGLVVESHDGRPTKIEGNELHPASLGAASAWMQAAILGLYDPDRSAAVRRRSATGFEPSSWDELAAFVAERRAVHLEDGGASLAVLGESHSSPTRARLEAELRAVFPAARIVSWEPAGDENVLAGLRLTTGQALRPVYDLERARVVLALDSDLLLTETDAVTQARKFAAGRAPDGEPNRLWVVESSLSVTGAAADERLRARRQDVPGFALAVARELAARGLPLVLDGFPSTVLPTALEAQARLVAADLSAAGSAGLVVAGRAQPPVVHALTALVNRALGAPVALHPAADLASGSTAELAELAAAMAGGEIETLAILGGNPVYDAPADLDFGAALAQVPHALHLGERVDETSRACAWHAPRAHFLEAWGDARAIDGTAGVVQPLIAPLLGGRSDLALLAMLAGADATAYDLVRDTWRRSILGEDAFEQRWQRVLHDGVAAESASTPVDAPVDSVALAAAWGELPPGGQDALEVTFHPSPATFDGRFANNGWLQELPDAITKITWDNVAHLSPATAAELGIASGDVMRLSLGDRSVEAPAWIAPGQADRSIALTLGYGRTAAGRVGNGVGYDAYRLRDASSAWFASGATLVATGARHRLAQTQEHWRMEGRHLAREATLSEYRENPHFATEPEEHFEPVELWPQHSYDDGYQWGMAIDLNACIGCNACVVACQSENNIPVVGADQVERGREMHWLRVDRYFAGELDEPNVVFQPVACQHCENAPCEQVCPVAATVHDEEGLNVMVYNRCIGTRYCSNNCPYKVRRFNFYNFTKDTPELVQLAMNPDVTVRSRGVMEKCTYCLQRINAAKITTKREGRRVGDGDLRTACQQTCPTQAITFGDVNDEESRVSAVKRDERNYLLLAELFNKPRTSYLAKIRNPRTEEPA
jgi:molybdopterin-containing oxidoreductase family iron-sulfur binding subunit